MQRKQSLRAQLLRWVLVPLSAYIATKGDWDSVFLFSAAISIIAGVAAKFALQPVRQKRIERVNERGAP